MESSISSLTPIRTPTKSNSSTTISPIINITKSYHLCSAGTKCQNLAFAVSTTPTRHRSFRRCLHRHNGSRAGHLSWQIVIGAIAGITPFVVAGIEFSKRIIAQQRCEVCGGLGLNYSDEEKLYEMSWMWHGGFLPWQSWKRFFTG